MQEAMKSWSSLMFALLVWKLVEVAGRYVWKRMNIYGGLWKNERTFLVYVNTPAFTIS